MIHLIGSWTRLYTGTGGTNGAAVHYGNYGDNEVVSSESSVAQSAVVRASKEHQLNMHRTEFICRRACYSKYIASNGKLLLN